MRSDFKRHDNYPPLSKPQKDVIEGSLLGDAHLELKGRHASFKFEQTTRHREYVDHLHDVLKPFSNEVKDHVVDKTKWGKGIYELSYFRTCCHPAFTEIHKRWYSGNIKIMPEDLRLNWKKVSYWFADDGHRKESSKKDMVICSENFTREENEKLSEILLRDLSVRTTLIKSSGGNGFRLRVKSDDYFDFIKRVSHIVGKFECFRHKVDVSRVSRQTNKIYSHEEKKEAIRMLNEGSNLELVAQKLGCHPVTIRRWING